MNRKDLLIQDLQNIIARHGIFDIGEVLYATSPRIETRGNLTSLIEEFRREHCIVVTYNDSYSIVDSYVLPYSRMSTKELGEVLDVCLLYQQQELDSD